MTTLYYTSPTPLGQRDPAQPPLQRASAGLVVLSSRR